MTFLPSREQAKWSRVVCSQDEGVKRVRFMFVDEASRKAAGRKSGVVPRERDIHLGPLMHLTATFLSLSLFSLSLSRLLARVA